MHRCRILIVVLAGLLFVGQGCASSAEASDPNAKSDKEDNGSNVGEGGGGIHPRWVLYDGDGTPVKAIVHATDSYPNWRPQSGQYGFENEPNQCVFVDAIKGREFPPVSYELQSGDVLPCVRKAGFGSPIFDDENCTGTPMLPIANSSTFRVQKWEGKAVWPKGTPVSLDEAYIFRDGECAEYSATNDKFVPLKPIPDWIRNAMPNPPYTVKPAY